jgi:hypothetical protein
MKEERTKAERARNYFEDKVTFTTGPVELLKAMKEGTVVVVDVRAAKDFAQEHVVGSINLPEDQWSTERGLDGDKRIALLCCSRCATSRSAPPWSSRDEDTR